MSAIKKVGFFAALLLLLAMSAVPANNAEQVVFSKTGGLMSLVGNSKTTATIWFLDLVRGTSGPW